MNKPTTHKFEFDGTLIEIDTEAKTVEVTEGRTKLKLWTASAYREGLVAMSHWNLSACPDVSDWVRDRMIYCFGLAERKIIQGLA